MSQLNQRIADYQRIVSANHGPITVAGDASWTLVTSKGEVPRLREFLTGSSKGIHHLNTELPPIFIGSGFELKFAAILVHGKPIVRPLEDFKKGTLKVGLSANPELGDLNVVFLFLDNAKNVRIARSIMYQAKVKRASPSSAISEEHQKYLYDRADGFQYRNGPYAGQNRQLPIAGKRSKGLHYLFVSEAPVNCSPVPSDQPAFSPWSESLFRLMLDADGIPLASGKARGNGWSKINEDLVLIFKSDAALKAYNLAELASWFNSFKNPNHWFAEAGNDSIGVGTLLVIVRDQKLTPDDDSIKARAVAASGSAELVRHRRKKGTQ